jgi:L-arabinose isomerase
VPSPFVVIFGFSSISYALASTNLPLIVLDTTPTYDFSPAQKPEEILYNHGIHGVQDMCNLLKKKKKNFLIKAGHWKESDVLEQVAGCARAAVMANHMRNARVGTVGAYFTGMGDFAVPLEELKSTIGMDVIRYDFGKSHDLLERIKDSDIDA